MSSCLPCHSFAHCPKVSAPLVPWITSKEWNINILGISETHTNWISTQIALAFPGHVLTTIWTAATFGPCGSPFTFHIKCVALIFLRQYESSPASRPTWWRFWTFGVSFRIWIWWWIWKVCLTIIRDHIFWETWSIPLIFLRTYPFQKTKCSQEHDMFRISNTQIFRASMPPPLPS